MTTKSAAFPVRQPSAQTILALARTRVHARLERAVGFPIMLVHAPRGYGKTTVLHEFFAGQEPTYRALQVGARHGDLLGFMREFALSLGDLVPALLPSFLGVYDRMHRVDDAAKEIATWAAGHLEPVELNLMIDGLENVCDDRVFALLSELVDQTSHAKIRWILVAQSADRFPIARWLANDRMDLPIDDEDLALTYDDLLAAIKLAQVPIPAAALQNMCAVTANWPAALALVLSELASRQWVSTDLTAPQEYSYFALRALAARSDLERRFLLETCLFKTFDDQLLELAGWRTVTPMLERLLEAGAIIVAITNGGYRYHEIFRLFLEAQLRACGPDTYARVAAESADVCRRVGRLSDSLELYIELGSVVQLATVLGECGFELIERGEADLVMRGLQAFGEADFATFPVALAIKASLESLRGSFDVAEAWFRHAIENLVDPRQRAAVVFRFATDLVRQDRRDAIELLQPFVTAGDHDLALSVSLAGLLATAYATHQQNGQAARTIERALEDMAGVQDTAVHAKLYFQAGYVAFFGRDFARAKNYARKAVDTALSSHLYDIAARALSILYNVAIDHEDDVRAGRACLDQLASCSVKAGSRHLLIYATLGQFEIEVLRGNLQESARLDEALKALEVDYSVFASETLLPAQALRATWSGDFHRAYRLVAPTAEKQITPARQSQRYAEIALYASAAGLHAETSAAVRRALTIASQCDPSDKSVVFTKAYVALALNLQGRNRRAQQVIARLTRSIALTPRLAYLVAAIGTINERWSQGRYSIDLREVLAQLTASDLGGIGRLIEALPLPEAFRGQFSHLTVHEREVLIHLSNGLDAREVATLSSQAPEVIDALIVSLCRKLGCSSPRHAIALAKRVDGLRIIAVNLR